MERLRQRQARKEPPEFDRPAPEGAAAQVAAPGICFASQTSIRARRLALPGMRVDEAPTGPSSANEEQPGRRRDSESHYTLCGLPWKITPKITAAGCLKGVTRSGSPAQQDHSCGVSGSVFANSPTGSLTRGLCVSKSHPLSLSFSRSADFADAIEPLAKRAPTSPATYSSLKASGFRRVTLARKRYSTRVAGIYSTRPSRTGWRT